MQRMNFKIAVFFVIAILLGLAIHFSNPAVSLILFLLWALTALFSSAAILIGLFNRKFRLWYLIGFLPFLVGLSFESSIRAYKHSMAIKLNAQLEEYNIRHGRYPENLEALDSPPALNGLRYSVSDDFSNDRIENLMDQYNREYFESTSKTWGTFGWND